MLGLILSGILAFASSPPDHAARGRFPRADRAVVDTLAALNRRVNREILGVDDQTHYGELDRWVSDPADQKGDCEDFALTKLVWLENNGFPAVTHSRLRFVAIHGADNTIELHVVLEVLLSDRSIAILDNRFDELMTRRELEKNEGYQFFDW